MPTSFRAVYILQGRYRATRSDLSSWKIAVEITMTYFEYYVIKVVCHLQKVLAVVRSGDGLYCNTLGFLNVMQRNLDSSFSLGRGGSQE